MLTLLSLALARPTDGGSYAFDATDVVTSLDSADGTVRVWYSAEGNNVVQAGDDDGDGLPDFAEYVAETAADVMVNLADFGFRAIVSDGERGGSAAMDVYLVDFGGDADGQYSTETCQDSVCSGYFVMENDFSGYGYPSDQAAIRTLTSHELFHAQQAVYNAGLDSWYAEGTAVWAERLYDPDNDDFLYFCSEYLDDTGRSLNVPPTGPVPSFAYGTALWWWFVTEQYGQGWMVDYLEATADEDLLLALDARVDLEADFVQFAEWNLATGTRAGLAESYSFAADIGPPKLEDSAPELDDDQRFYPLSTTYYRLEWPGGELSFALDNDAPDIVFQLWSTQGDAIDARVAEPESTAGVLSLGELPVGDYYLLGVNPTLADDSTKVRFCLGADAVACVPQDTAGPSVTPEPQGCGCSGAGVSGWWAFLGAVVMRRRSGAVRRHGSATVAVLSSPKM